MGWAPPAAVIPLPQGPWCQGESEISIPIILSSLTREKPCRRPPNGIQIRAVGPSGSTAVPFAPQGYGDDYYEESYLTTRTYGEPEPVGTSKGFRQPSSSLADTDTFHHQVS